MCGFFLLFVFFEGGWGEGGDDGRDLMEGYHIAF